MSFILISPVILVARIYDKIVRKKVEECAYCGLKIIPFRVSEVLLEGVPLIEALKYKKRNETLCKSNDEPILR